MYTQEIFSVVWAPWHSFCTDFTLWLWSASLEAIWIEMILLSLSVGKGNFFLFNICLIGMWPQPSSTSHSLLVCFGCIREKRSWEVYFSVMRCGAVSRRRVKEQKQPISPDPVTLQVFTYAGPNPSPFAAGVQQYTIGLERLLRGFHKSIKG